LYRNGFVKIPLPFVATDVDDDSLYDSIEWVAPHLSNQTFEISIKIYDAEHRDVDSCLLRIYSSVNDTDGITVIIPAGDFVRAYFEKNLTNGNVIDIVTANAVPADIVIYEKGFF